MREILDVAATICIGWMIGTEFVVSVFIGPVLEKLGPRKGEGNQPVRAEARYSHALLVRPSASSFLSRRQQCVVTSTASASSALATAIWVIVILLTVLLLVPINNRIAKLESESFSDQLQQQHRRWKILHHGRVAALAVAMVCFCIAIQG